METLAQRGVAAVTEMRKGVEHGAPPETRSYTVSCFPGVTISLATFRALITCASPNKTHTCSSFLTELCLNVVVEPSFQKKRRVIDFGEWRKGRTCYEK